MKVKKCLVSVYGDIHEEVLLRFLNNNQNLKIWAYAVNDFKKYLPNAHVYLDFGKNKLKISEIENSFKDYGFKRSFVEAVISREDDIIGFLDSLGYDRRKMAANFKFNRC